MSTTTIFVEVVFDIDHEQTDAVSVIFERLRREAASNPQEISWTLTHDKLTLNAQAPGEEAFGEALRHWGPMLEALDSCARRSRFEIKGRLSHEMMTALKPLNPTFTFAYS